MLFNDEGGRVGGEAGAGIAPLSDTDGKICELHKMYFLLTEAGSGAVDMMRTIKRALDPDNILNPGKIFAV